MALRVIGAGYGRTGTASLKLALERLGFGPCHHMSEVLPRPERVELWRRIGAGEALWDEAFAGYASTVDWPAATHWRALAAHYPEAKVILSTRDAGRWFESVNETILSEQGTEALRGSPIGEMLGLNIWRLFGDGMFDRASMVEAFERHTAEVRAGVDAGRLLVFEAKDGWGPLCAFLGVGVPAEEFPRVNSREETRRFMEILATQRDGTDTEAMDSLVRELYREGGG